MQDFHDTYASGKGKKFAIGETGSAPLFPSFPRLVSTLT